MCKHVFQGMTIERQLDPVYIGCARLTFSVRRIKITRNLSRSAEIEWTEKDITSNMADVKISGVPGTHIFLEDSRDLPKQGIDLLVRTLRSSRGHLMNKDNHLFYYVPGSHSNNKIDVANHGNVAGIFWTPFSAITQFLE